MTEAEIARFVYHEARLLDERRWDEWLALFTEDAHYWVPLARGQTDAEEHNSLAYEDMLLLRLRVERLKQGAPSQQPPSFSQHVLQAPEIVAAGPGWQTRTPFAYAEARGDAMLWLAGTAEHAIVRGPDGGPRIARKRVDLLNCDAALPSIQLFL